MRPLEVIAVNEGYANEAGTTTTDRPTLDRKAEHARARTERRRLHEMMTGPGAVAGLNLPKIEDAIARAPRKRKDKAGKQRTIGPKVAKMVKKLLILEGRGELPDNWIHKTRREWTTEEAPLTRGELRTARRVAGDEGLIEEKEDFRPSDGQRTTSYRVDMWAVARVVVRSELERYREVLGYERRVGQRSIYEKRLVELERASNDLAVVDGEATEAVGEEPDPPNPEAEDEGVQTLQRGGDNSAPLHPGTYTRVPSTDVYSVGDGIVAKAAPGDAPASDLGKEGYEHPSMDDNKTSTRGSDPSEAEEDGCARTAEEYHEVYDQLGALMRGGDGTVERFCGRMTSRHLEGEGFSFDRLARILRRFVPAEPEMGEEEFAGIVREVLDEIRAEHERQREARWEKARAAVDEVGDE